jgi:hypothetical protein
MSLERKMSRNQKAKRMLDRVMRQQRKDFIAKFGREPGPNDPLLFDPDSDIPTPIDEERMTREMVAAMAEAGTPGHLIHAYVKTGLILDDEGYRNATPAVRVQWDAAVAEYEELQKRTRQ